MPILLIFAASGLLCLAAFAASYLADNPGCLPDVGSILHSLFPVVPAAVVSLPDPGPFYCETTRRWRDPVSRRFVKAPH